MKRTRQLKKVDTLGAEHICPPYPCPQCTGQSEANPVTVTKNSTPNGNSDAGAENAVEMTPPKQDAPTSTASMRQRVAPSVPLLTADLLLQHEREQALLHGGRPVAKPSRWSSEWARGTSETDTSQTRPITVRRIGVRGSSEELTCTLCNTAMSTTTKQQN